MGDKEREAGTVSVRSHDEGDIGALELREAIKRISDAAGEGRSRS
jgi:threonyl-tRNA synthetase